MVFPSYTISSTSGMLTSAQLLGDVLASPLVTGVTGFLAVLGKTYVTQKAQTLRAKRAFSLPLLGRH